MNTATISFTKNNLSALLDRVRHGETITILDRDKPVARIVPIERTSDTAWEARLAELERRGVLRRGTGKVADWILREPPPKPSSGYSIVDEVLREREESP